MQPRRAGRPAAQQRRREVESCLARWELLRRPRPLRPGAGPADASLVHRLQGALEELGPVFTAFGAYLASRIDLVTASEGLALAAIRSRAAPLPIGAVRERIAAELGAPAAEAFAALEETPYESRLLVQVHRGRLASGEPVILRLVRTEEDEAFALDLEMLSRVAEALAANGWSALAAEEAVAGFRQDLQEQTSFRSVARSLELLAGDAAGFGRLAVPSVFPDLTTSRLLTTADLGGVSLGEIGRVGARSLGGPDRREIVRHLCSVWLRQALLGRAFPVELGPEDVRVLPDGRIGWQGAAFVRPPAAAQADLLGFVIAVAARDPDEACTRLLPEMLAEGTAASEEELRLQLRQIVPFRDGAWSAGGESLAEHLFVYARVARSCGYRPRYQLLVFYRGLFATAAAARGLAPEMDALLEGLQEVRVLTSFSQVRDAIRPDHWGGQLDRYAALLSVLPQKLDELLTLAAEGSDRSVVAEPGRRPRPQGSSSLVVASLLMVLGAAALVLRRLAESGALAGRGDEIAAALFLVFGGFLLWVARRAG